MTFAEEDVKKYGFVAVPKCIQSAPWYGKPAMIVWLHLYMNATYIPKTLAGVDLVTGEMLGSVQQIATATGLTVKTVRNAIETLKAAGDIEARTASSTAGIRTVFKVCGYACIARKQEGQKGLPLAKQGTATNSRYAARYQGRKGGYLGQTVK